MSTQSESETFQLPFFPTLNMHDSRKSNLNLFQRHTKATRRRKIVILKGFSSQREKGKISLEKGRKLHAESGGWEENGRFVEPKRNRRVLHDGNSCLIVVFWLFLHLAIIAPNSF